MFEDLEGCATKLYNSLLGTNRLKLAVLLTILILHSQVNSFFSSSLTSLRFHEQYKLNHMALPS